MTTLTRTRAARREQLGLTRRHYGVLKRLDTPLKVQA
jgi:hypothetical protein